MLLAKVMEDARDLELVREAALQGGSAGYKYAIGDAVRAADDVVLHIFNPNPLHRSPNGDGCVKEGPLGAEAPQYDMGRGCGSGEAHEEKYSKYRAEEPLINSEYVRRDPSKLHS